MPTYTCREYRLEMILLGLKRRLKDPGLTEEEKNKIRIEIRELEEQMGL